MRVLGPPPAGIQGMFHTTVPGLWPSHSANAQAERPNDATMTAKVNQPAWRILAARGSSLDAVIAGANVVELDPEDTSVGYGGLPNEEGVVQLDASVMSGKLRKSGAVGALERVKTPSSVARVVLERTDHVMIVGEGALRFARAHGFEEANLLTEKARLRWLKWKENLSPEDDWLPPADGIYLDHAGRPSGTINVLAVDAAGDVAGCTTTSGLAWKIPGRLGDSPIVGAGLYVDNEVGAAGATGRGEEVITTWSTSPDHQRHDDGRGTSHTALTGLPGRLCACPRGCSVDDQDGDTRWSSGCGVLLAMRNRAVVALTVTALAAGLLAAPSTQAAPPRVRLLGERIIPAGSFQGTTVGGLSGQFPGSQLSPAALDFRPYPGGVDGYIKRGLFREVFAADVSPATAASSTSGAHR